MHSRISTLLLVSLACLPNAACRSTASEAEEAGRLSHAVFFTLHDDSAKARDALIGGSYEYLADIPGILYFTAGRRVEDIAGAANDTEYDVALHVVFTGRGALDRYLVDEAHIAYIETFNENWASVKVYDSKVR